MDIKLLRRLVLLGTPFMLFVLEFFHTRELSPTVFEALSPVVDRWLTVHVLQLILFGFLGLAVYLLIGDKRGLAATISRFSIGLFVVFYGAFDTLAGIATGILVRNTSGLPEAEKAGAERVIQSLFEAAEIGSFAAFKIIGELGWFLGILAAVIALSETERLRISLALLASAATFIPILQGSYTNLLGIVGILVTVALVVLTAPTSREAVPFLLLATSAVSFTFGHPAPFGPLAFFGFFLGAALLEIFPSLESRPRWSTVR